MSVTGRVEELHEYLEHLYRGRRNRNLYDSYADVLTTVTPAEVNGAIHLLIDNHDDMDRVEDAVARFIRAAGTGLDGRPLPEVPRGHFIELLLEENRALREHLGRLSAAFKDFSAKKSTGTEEAGRPTGTEEGTSADDLAGTQDRPTGTEEAGSARSEGRPAGTEVRDLLRRTLDITSHYRKIQYTLFPAMEKHIEAFNCTKLMWHLQDSVLAGLKELIGMLDSPGAMNFAAFNRLFGKIYLRLGTLAYREERVLYPVVLETVPEERFTDMLRDLEEHGTSFGVVPEKPVRQGSDPSEAQKEDSMSENLKNHEERKKQLKEIILNLKDESDIPKMRKQFTAILKDLSPEEIAEAEQALIEEGLPVEEVQKLCDVHVAAFQAALHSTGGDGGKAHRIPGHPVHTYREENRRLKKHLRSLKKALRALKRGGGWETLEEILQTLGDIEFHFARKENQLFPFLEAAGFTGPSKVMWGKHDEIRAMLKELNNMTGAKNVPACRSTGGRLVRSLKSLILMEEKILYPTALRKLPETAWKEIRKGEAEIGYAWIKPGNLWDPSVLTYSTLAEGAGDSSTEGSSVPGAAAGGSSVPAESAELDLSVGRLLPKQIDLMLKNLPVDITYVDEHDRVRYYSQGKERIFPRSPGIIGRSVQNCHPPKSVHVVQKIVDDFKARRRDVADFWLEIGGRFIYIRYFPLFEGEAYKGVLEVSQDVTEIRRLEGEKRLLDEE